VRVILQVSVIMVPSGSVYVSVAAKVSGPSFRVVRRLGAYTGELRKFLYQSVQRFSISSGHSVAIVLNFEFLILSL